MGWSRSCTPFKHVATYVSLESKASLMSYVRKASKKKKLERTTFGWCNYPNNLPRMMNSLRLELTDEAALILLERDEDVYLDDLCVVGE